MHDDTIGASDRPGAEEEPKITVYFNPFAHTIEENNEFLRLGYEVMPIRVPDTKLESNTDG